MTAGTGSNLAPSVSDVRVWSSGEESPRRVRKFKLMIGWCGPSVLGRNRKYALGPLRCACPPPSHSLLLPFPSLPLLRRHQGRQAQFALDSPGRQRDSLRPARI
jgi:hypothetical protein